MPSIDELLAEHARLWREHVDAHDRGQETPAHGSMTALPSPLQRPFLPHLRSRPVLVGVGALLAGCVGAAIAALVVSAGSASVRNSPLGNGSPALQPTSTSRPGTQTRSRAPIAPVPSPTSQAWGNCGNIRDEADARSLVASGEANALVTAQMTGKVVRSYEVLAGRAPRFETLNVAVPAGRYLLLLGGVGSGDYYAALGYYGVYHLTDGHAFQLCAYGDPHVDTDVARHGVTDARQVIELFRDALND